MIAPNLSTDEAAALLDAAGRGIDEWTYEIGDLEETARRGRRELRQLRKKRERALNAYARLLSAIEEAS